MCGRSSLTKTEKEIEERFGASFYSDALVGYNPLPNYNVSPTQLLPIVAMSEPTTLKFMHWGLVPTWAENSKIGSKMINARLETLSEKSAFKGLINTNRCLVPMDGFYEWQKLGSKTKQAYRIILKGEKLFAVAGLHTTWHGKNNEEYESFTVITQPANHLMSQVHDRMPAILLPEQESIWLDDEISPIEVLKIIVPYPNEEMEIFPISDLINKAGVNDKRVADRVEPRQVTTKQLGLFD